MARIGGFGVTVGLHSLEVQGIFGSVGLSQDWRWISALVGSSGLVPGCSESREIKWDLWWYCWPQNPLGQPGGYSRANASCAFKGLLAIKWAGHFLLAAGKKSSIFPQKMNTYNIVGVFSFPRTDSLWSVQNSGCPEKEEHSLHIFIGNSNSETVQHKVLISFSLHGEPVRRISLGSGKGWQ